MTHGHDAAAAAGLVIIMVGATVITAMIGPVAMAVLPFIVGVLAVFVAYGRWRVTPHRGASEPAPSRSGLAR